MRSAMEDLLCLLCGLRERRVARGIWLADDQDTFRALFARPLSCQDSAETRCVGGNDVLEDAGGFVLRVEAGSMDR